MIRSSTTSSSRKRFIAAIGAAAALFPNAPLAVAASVDAPVSGRQSLSDALVLSGGGARGAYQAGVICALARLGGISDGQPLHPYSLVCGSSIGALNAWFVSTGQYRALRSAWGTIASANVVALKKKYAALMEPQAFGLGRLYEYLHLSLAMSRHEQSIAQSSPILAWMATHIDPQIPVVTPMVWAVTNMTMQSGEYFYRLPPAIAGRIPAGVEHAIQVVLGANTVIRPATDDILHRALLASAAIPILFDPVVLPMVDGTNGVYIDGSIVANAAVSIARTVASNVNVILVDAKSGRMEYPNAVAVAFGAYGTMQRDILETAMRDIYFQTLEERSRADKGDDLPLASIGYIRPDQPLSDDMNAFRDQSTIDRMFALGEKAAASGFQPYAWKSFHL